MTSSEAKQSSPEGKIDPFLKDVTIHLRDRKGHLAAEWRKSFEGVANVVINIGDIFTDKASGKSVRADAIVSPANSFGFMDGGIDLDYSEKFGWQLQHRLQAKLREEFDGELLVGQALIIETGDTREDESERIPFLVSAPTMRVPHDVHDTVNAYLAFRATLIAVRDHNKAGKLPPIRTLLCPGLGTAVGQMPYDRCAKQMRRAYDRIVMGNVWLHETWMSATYEHDQLSGGIK